MIDSRRAEALRDHIAAIPAMYANLPALLTTPAITATGGGRAVPGSRPPLDVTVVDLLDVSSPRDRTEYAPDPERGLASVFPT